MKLGLLSNQKLNPWINWSTLGPPLLSAIARNGDAELISPPPLGKSSFGQWSRVCAQARRADTLFWIQPSARPELEIHLAAFSKLNLRRSAYVYDAFKPSLDKIGLLATAQRLNPCFVAFREAADELSKRFPKGRFEWLPFGVDTSVFSQSNQDRPIFAFWMGRRHEPLHAALLSYCEQRGLRYIYRNQTGVFMTPDELGRTVSLSKYFVVTPPNLDDPERTGGFSPLVMRYIEGLAGGARLLGVLPRSGEYEALLPTEAICQVAPSGEDLSQRIEEDLARPERWEAVEYAREVVLEQHSWARRGEQVYQRLREGR